MNVIPSRCLVLIRLLLCFGFGFSLTHAQTEKKADPAKREPVPTPAPAGDPMENSVVKVFSTMRNPDLSKPWTKQSPQEATGSGIVIEGKRILTNAHLALYASQILVQANQEGDKIPATVVAIAPGIDLALLKLDDESFFETHRPLSSANGLPSIKDSVMVYGYPTGGSSLSITKGIVSRIEFTGYNSHTSGLRIQIDAAINPGNSGGPVFVDDKMIGLAFSRLGSGDNIGYIIPTEEIDLFLTDIADGRYDGKPAIYDRLQTLENPSLRSFLKLDKSIEGIVVHEPFQTNPSYPLKEWDVITQIGDTRIDNQGMVKAGENLRLRFQYLIQKLAHEGMVPLTVVRKGQTVTVAMPTLMDRPSLIRDLKGDYPPYFACGPLVFSIASAQLVGSFSKNATALNLLSYLNSPLVTRRTDKPAFDGEELVIVSSPFFPHKLSRGYSNPSARVVKAINGIRVKNLLHLVELFRDATDEFIVVEFDMQGGESLVFPRKEMIDATDDILTDNGIRSQGSPEVLAIWNAKSKGSTTR